MLLPFYRVAPIPNGTQVTIALVGKKYLFIKLSSIVGLIYRRYLFLKATLEVPRLVALLTKRIDRNRFAWGDILPALTDGACAPHWVNETARIMILRIFDSRHSMAEINGDLKQISA